MSTDTAFRRITSEVVDGVLVIGFRGGPGLKLIETPVVREFRRELTAAIGERDRVLLDFTNVDYFNSVALGAVQNNARRLGKKGKTLVLCCVRPEILVVFSITWTTPGLCQHYANRQSALQALKG
ncbi:MAG: STAS domain-containing protein [Candidatus Peribacteraceae bacterium]|nr:STAS domain-containing protein [Candidatus Peribacteraceae bacterium]MDD5742176.1 STAS domain-containing protein [Candidatus Peribacteraceae bacterium]